MKSLLFVFFTICSLITSSNYDDIDKGLELTFKAEYRKSAEIWENLLKKNGSIKVEFFCLFNKYIEIIDTESYYNSSGFLSECNSLLKKFKEYKTDGNSEEFLFYKSALFFFNGGIEFKKKNFLKGYSISGTGNRIAEKILENSPDFFNVYLISGAYNYWKNRFFDSLPLIKKDYRKYISLIEKSLEGDKYVRFMALHQLAWIYYLNGEFEKSKTYCEMGLKDFPESRLFLKPFAENYKKTGNLALCRSIYEKITESYKNSDYENNYVNIKYCVKLAELYNNTGEPLKSRELVNYVNNLILENIEKKVSKKYLKRLKRLGFH